ncbi:MAG: HTH domain-containing protein [Clostridiales Family XIII bacterium]|nr:HTH domain-containing protein [Clostridiales Family XIII bacterium]
MVETLVHYNQALYYRALPESHIGEVDCRPFIDCMLDIIENSMYKFIDVATETKDGESGLIETHQIDSVVGVNVGVKNDILELLKKQPSLSAGDIAKLVGKSTRTIERHIKELREQSLLVRIGSDKYGHWEVRQ